MLLSGKRVEKDVTKAVDIATDVTQVGVFESYEERSGQFGDFAHIKFYLDSILYYVNVTCVANYEDIFEQQMETLAQQLDMEELTKKAFNDAKGHEFKFHIVVKNGYRNVRLYPAPPAKEEIATSEELVL